MTAVPLAREGFQAPGIEIFQWPDIVHLEVGGLDLSINRVVLEMLVVGLLLFLLRDTTAFDRAWFALALVAGTVVYLAAEIRFAVRARVPYVVTDEKQTGPR